DTELLDELAAQRVARFLTGFDLAARELPATGERDGLRTASREQPRRGLEVVHDRPGDHEGARLGVQHGRSLPGGRAATSAGSWSRWRRCPWRPAVTNPGGWPRPREPGAGRY